jgi:ribonucleoside-diphosphate reductase beta chain
VFWLPNEVKVEKDVHDIYTGMTEAERHGVLTTLKLFSLYELYAGVEFWGGVVARNFPRPEIQRMAATFSMFELAIHQPFYNKLNEVLGIATEEFYNSYVQDPVLKDRADFLEDIQSNSLAVSLGTFSMMEGAILYSSFAFLKHFQSEGKNRLMNVVRGINFSTKDEALHAEAGAWLFSELRAEGRVSAEDDATLCAAADTLREHEHRIVDMIFEKGRIEGITDVQLKHFVDSRLNICLKNLGIDKRYPVKYNPLADTFYNNVNGYTSNDFFTSIGSQYKRGWAETEFKW